MIWKGYIDAEGLTLCQSGYNAKEIIDYNPPGMVGMIHRPGVLITYSKGEKYWAGRGSRAYAPAQYTVHVVTTAETLPDGRIAVEWTRHEDVPTSIAKAREAREKQRGRQHPQK